MSYFCGIEGGALKTICYLVNDRGEILGRGEAGASLHYEGSGPEQALGEIKNSIERAIVTSGERIEQITTACFGLAGIDSRADYNRVYTALRRENPARNILLENDAVTALVGGNGEAYGVVLVAGIGAISFGINRRGQRKRAGGWGHKVGDEGSGYDIAATAIKAALKAHDGRERPTLLVPLFMEHLGLDRMEDIVAELHFSLGRAEIAALAQVVFQAAKERDRVAQKILIRAGDELGQAINAVITGLDLTDEEISIPLVGQVFENEGKELLIDVIKEKVLNAAPRAEITEPQFEPAIGAAIYALSHSGIDINGEILHNLRKTHGELGESWRKQGYF